MAKKLTVKQKKYVAEYINNGGNGVRAALKAYNTNSYRSADRISNENQNKPLIREAIESKLDIHNITIDSALAPIGKALVAKKMNVDPRTGDSYMSDLDDIDLQLKGSDRALKLLGVNKDAPQNLTFIQYVALQRDRYGL